MMKKMDKLIQTMLVAALLVGAGRAQAFNLFPQYCAVNPRAGNLCFKTREQAESHVREDPSSGYGRSTLKEKSWNTPNGSDGVFNAQYGTPMVPWDDHERDEYEGFHSTGAEHYANCGSVNKCASEAALEASIGPGGTWKGSHFEDPPPGWTGQSSVNDRGRLYVNRKRPSPDTRELEYPDGPDWVVTQVSRYWCPLHYKAYTQGFFRISFAAWPNTCSNDETGSVSSKVRQAAQCSVGNPCIPANGGKTDREIDFEWQGINFTRSYHSIRDFNAAAGLGEGWTHAFGWRLHENSGNSSYIDVLSDDLTIEVFKRIGSTTTFRSLNQDGRLLTRAGAVSAPQWTLLLGEGRSLHFDADGRLTAMKWADRPQQDVALDYCDVAEYQGGLCAAVGMLHKVTNTLGRSLVFTYYSMPENALSSPARLASVASDGGMLVEYGYDAIARLTTVTYPSDMPATVTRSYVYNEPSHICREADGTASPGCTFSDFPHHLTGIVDEDQVRFADYYYDDYGRVTRSVRAGGAGLVKLQYLGDYAARVTMPSGSMRDYEFGRPSAIFPKQMRVEEGTEARAFQYLADGRPFTVSRPNGAVTQFEYDATHRTAMIRAKGTPQQQRIENDWNASLHRVLETRTRDAANALVARMTYTYNGRGQLSTASTIDPSTLQARTTTQTYCEAVDVAAAGTCPILGLLKSIDGPRADVADTTMFAYYASSDLSGCNADGPCHRKGDLWKVTNAVGHVTEVLRYDLHGRPTSTRDANNVLTDVVHHPRGWVSARKLRGNNNASESDDAITAITYWPTGQVKRVTNPDGDFLEYGYDAAHRLTSVEDALGHRREFVLNAAGQQTDVVVKDELSAIRHQLSRTYDLMQRIDLEKNSLGQTVRDHAYNAQGLETSVIDGAGTATSSEYDALERLTKTVADYGQINAETRFKYDALDRLTQVTDPKGLDTNYVYDGFGDLVLLESPDTGSTAFTFDEAGQPTTRTDARAVTSTTSYDAIGRVTSTTFPTTSENIVYHYDQPDATTGCSASFPNGRLTGVTDESGSTTYCYDRFGHTKKKTQLIGAVSLATSYEWTLGGRLAATLYPGGAKFSIERDAAGHATALKRTVGFTQTPLVTAAQYEPFGPLAHVQFASGELTLAYDADYAIDAIGGDALAIDYDVDVLGNIGALDAGGVLRTYDYDALSRLTRVEDAGSVLLERFEYDKTGNRTLKETANSIRNYSYPATSHRLAAIDAQARSYDAMGNTLSNGTLAFVYNNAQRLSQVHQGGSLIQKSAYNALGQRVAKTSGTGLGGGNTIYFVYDEAGRVLAEYKNDSASLQRQYLWLDDRLVAVAIHAGAYAGELLQVHTDHLGTPRALKRPAGGVVWRWGIEGGVFGDDLPASDPDRDGVDLVFNLRFPGQYFDIESELSYNYFRDYEPGTGRYIESDPIGIWGGIATFGYASQTPLVQVDARGLSSAVLEVGKEAAFIWGVGGNYCFSAAVLAKELAQWESDATRWPGPGDGPRDALRHCTWTCKITRVAGTKCAQIAGFAHEAEGFGLGQKTEQGLMDFANNRQGEMCGLQDGDDSCLVRCKNAYMACKLQIIGGVPGCDR